jgi:hypothetical protein
MRFKDFRHSRFLSQGELSMLLGVTIDWVRWHDPRPLKLYWAGAIDDMLGMGPHSFIKPRYFYPPIEGLPTVPMEAVKRRRLPLGSCYLSLEYFEPGTLEIAQSRKDLLAIAKRHPAERLLILRRVIARHKAGVQVIGVKLPNWPPPKFDIKI